MDSTFKPSLLVGTQFSRAPWIKVSNRIIKSPTQAVTGEEPVICEIPYGFRPANWRENTALILAAPRLYEALEMAVMEIEQPGRFKHAALLCEHLRQALALARDAGTVTDG